VVWFKVDDGFYDHPKVFDLSDSAVALWTRAGSWASRNTTDGFVPSNLPARFCGDPETAVRELVDRRLWRRTRGGFQFHDWQDYNPLAETVIDKRDKARKRMRKLRQTRREDPIIAGSDDDGSRELRENFGVTPRERSRELRDPRPVPVPKGSSDEEPSPPIRRTTKTPRGDPEFEAFYAAYPKHVGRKAAEAAWKKAIRSADPQAVIAGAKRYADERAGQNPQYTKQPATWLNQGCWEDDPQPRPGQGHLGFRNPDDPNDYYGDL
jgi:hypothetical protein